MKHPLLQSSANRVILAIGLILALAVILTAIGNSRDNAEATACKEQGGTPVYRTETRRVPDNWNGDGTNQDIQFFDHCAFD